MQKHEHIDYIEWSAKDMLATKKFFEHIFSWKFTEYGENYMDFDTGTMRGGFYRAEMCSLWTEGGALVVFYSEELERTQIKIEEAGGVIVKPIFSFPGGRRFQFIEPSGNEFGVWSDK